MNVSLIVNAGGQSRRMGRDKALLPVPGAGTTLLAYIIQRLEPLVTGEVIVVSSRAVTARGDPAAEAGLPPSVRVVADLWPETGALGGLATGLTSIQEWGMCVACDMPFVSPALMALLMEQARAATRIDAVIPFVQGRYQPFHGLYHARMAEHLARSLAGGNLRVVHALAGADVQPMEEDAVRQVDPHLRAVWNVNTPEDWVQAQVWLAEEA